MIKKVIKILLKVIKYLIPSVLAVILLMFAFKNIELSEFLEKIKETNFWWVIASILLSLFSYAVRAYRWNLMLEPLGYTHLSTMRTSLAVLVGYLANLAFPRLGEVSRCASLKKTDDIPMGISFGSVFSERLFDALSLLFFISLSFLIEYELIFGLLSNYFSGYEINGFKVLITFLIFILGVVAFFVFIRKVKNNFTHKVLTIVRQILMGITSVRRMKKFKLFLLSTLLLWLTYYSMSYIIIYSLDETSFLSLSAGFLLLVISGIALALPVQGGIGTFHTLVSALFVLYGIKSSTALFLATLLHTSQLVSIAVFGGIAVLITVFISRAKNKEKESE